jgi:hypothetical protein
MRTTPFMKPILIKKNGKTNIYPAITKLYNRIIFKTGNLPIFAKVFDCRKMCNLKSLI